MKKSRILLAFMALFAILLPGWAQMGIPALSALVRWNGGSSRIAHRETPSDTQVGLRVLSRSGDLDRQRTQCAEDACRQLHV